MIALAVSNNALTCALLAAGSLVVDYLETAGPLAESALQLQPRPPLLLHNVFFGWSLGHPDALSHPPIVPAALDLLLRTGSPWLSLHLGFSAVEVEFRESRQHPCGPLLAREQLLERCCRHILALRAALPVPLLLENLDSTPTGAYEHICAPDFIKAVVAR